MKLFDFNGASLEFDPADADHVERLEKATAKMASDEQALPKIGTHSEKIRAQCRMIMDYFNGVFGDGADKALFGERTNLDQCMDAFTAFLEHVREGVEQTKAKTARISSYLPKK